MDFALGIDVRDHRIGPHELFHIIMLLVWQEEAASE